MYTDKRELKRFDNENYFKRRINYNSKRKLYLSVNHAEFLYYLLNSLELKDKVWVCNPCTLAGKELADYNEQDLIDVIAKLRLNYDFFSDLEVSRAQAAGVKKRKNRLRRRGYAAKKVVE